MNRIVERFARLKREGRKGLIVYIGAGDPDLDATRRLALAFDRVGVDVLELGVPFSDPLADGLVNQLAAQRGLESGTTPLKVLKTVAVIRQESPIPIVLYLYFNLIHRAGLERFIQEAAKAGVAGQGFSVVAQEIRKLADLTRTVSDNVSAVIRDSNRGVEKMLGRIKSLGTGFTEIVTSSDGTRVMIADNSRALEGVTKAHRDIQDGLAGVDTLIRSILEVSSELRQMTDRLASAFSWFGETLKLKEESVAGLAAAEPAPAPEA
jgi:tryptophan synthase alpha subunit